jgi:hypothetical protein
MGKEVNQTNGEEKYQEIFGFMLSSDHGRYIFHGRVCG